MDDVDFYLIDLKSKFDKIKPNTYYLSYSGIKAMKIGKDEVEYYLKPKYGTEAVKHSTYYITNLKMKDSFNEDYGTFN